MSVPKRFKTKIQKNYFNKTPRVFTKGSTYHLLDKDLLFIHTVSNKKINAHDINYNVKK